MKSVSKLTAAFACAAFAASLLSSYATADIIYSENADGLTAGSDTLQSSTDWNGSSADYGVLAGGAVFSTNHFDLNAPDGNFNFANWEPTGPHSAVQTFSIELADTGGGGTNVDAGVRIAARQTGGSTFFDVVSQNLTDNQVYTFHVVANNSGSTVTYEDGVTTIAAGTLELWQDGVRVGTKNLNSGASGDIFSWGLWSRRPDDDMLADNIRVHDTAFNGVAAVPEPAAASLLGLAILGLAGRRRRS